jgi:glycosyltransferase involved in cell wall biosynthesis
MSSGIYEAWNIGIKAAQTPYITNANCDDRLYPGALKKMADILDKETTYGVVYANQDIVTEIGGDPIGQFTWAEGGLKELMQGCFVGPMPMWRRKLHDRYGYFDENYKSAGDYEYWLRLANGGVKFYHVRDWASGAYLQRKNSVEHREPLRSLWETNNIRMRYREVANV